MGYHASTAERLPILETFFKRAWRQLPPSPAFWIWLAVESGSSLDAHGTHFSYTARDIYEDMLEGLQLLLPIL